MRKILCFILGQMVVAACVGIVVSYRMFPLVPFGAKLASGAVIGVLSTTLIAFALADVLSGTTRAKGGLRFVKSRPFAYGVLVQIVFNIATAFGVVVGNVMELKGVQVLVMSAAMGLATVYCVAHTCHRLYTGTDPANLTPA